MSAHAADAHATGANERPAGQRPDAKPAPRKLLWQRVRRIGLAVFLGAVAYLIYRQASKLHWGQIWGAATELPASTLAVALALAALSHLLYSTYDLLGRHMTGHKLGTGTTMGVAFISYAFNINLGSIIGSVGFRYRLYSRLKLAMADIGRVVGFSILTNWLGYLFVAGLAFAIWPLALPPAWKIDSGGLRLLGVVLLAGAALYLALCAIYGQHVWRIRGHEMETPTLRMALLQLGMASVNWALMGAIVWLLLQRQVDYPHVLAVLLLAAVAGVIVHVPAGLGVIETVFVALLGHLQPEYRLLAALLVYRAVYYLLPLLLACVLYVVTELRARRLGQRAAGSAGAQGAP